jgi:hypothetical protein
MRDSHAKENKKRILIHFYALRYEGGEFRLSACSCVPAGLDGCACRSLFAYPWTNFLGATSAHEHTPLITNPQSKRTDLHEPLRAAPNISRGVYP